MAQPRAGEAGCAGLRQHAVYVALVLRCGCACEGERGRPQVEVEQAIAKARLVVVVLLGLRGGDDLDLPAVEAEALIDRANLRLGRLRVGQENPNGAAFDDGRRDAGVLNVRQALRGEDDTDIALAQRLQPLADTRCKYRVIQEQPGFIKDQQRGRTIESFIEAGEQVAQHRPHGGGAGHQFLHLEALNVRAAQPVAVGIQQLAVRATQHIGRECLAQRVRLQQHRKPRHRALLHGRTGKASERRPDGRLLIRADGHAFVQQAAFHPFGGPGAVAALVDACQRLKGDPAIGTQVVVFAAQAQDGGAHGAAHVEDEDARVQIAPELHRQHGQEGRLAHAGRADHGHVAHVADVRDQAERRCAVGARDDHRRAVQVLVALRAGPHRRQRHHVREVQRRDDGLAHVGIRIARHRRQPRIHGIERFGDGDEAAPLNHALHHAQLFVGHGRVGIEHRHRGREVAEGDLIAAQLLHGGVRIGRLVAGVGIDQRAFLLEDRFAQQRDDVLALGKPLAAQAA